jgi:dihydrofolate reductase
MSKLRVNCFSISLDDYGAGPDQDEKNPLGIGGTQVHGWMFPTRTFQKTLFGKDGETGVDDEFVARGFENVGAWILGRNMFGPIRGAWPDDAWKGWWGKTPPYHCDVFVLTHHARASFEMDGGTRFHFVTGGIHEALERARKAAGEKDVRLGGGVSTLKQYLNAKLVDDVHYAVSPVLLGRGENLFTGLDLPALGYRFVERVATPKATHIRLARDGR